VQGWNGMSTTRGVGPGGFAAAAGWRGVHHSSIASGGDADGKESKEGGVRRGSEVPKRSRRRSKSKSNKPPQEPILAIEKPEASGKGSKAVGASNKDKYGKTHPRRSRTEEKPTPPPKPYRARHDPHFSLEDKAERLKKKGIVLTGEVPKAGLLALNTLRPTVPNKQKKRVRKVLPD
jgi:hypothetical protein